MTRALTRTHLHNSRLIRILTDLAILDAAEPGTAFAEKLGLWVDFADANTLFSVLNTHPASPAAAMPSGALSMTRVAASEAFDRIRSTLATSITKRSLPPTALPGVPTNVAAAYEPYRRSYLALQRDMELNIRPLRAQVREWLGRASPALKKLAALDATLDGILSEREKKLFSNVPRLLQQRFDHLFKAQPPTHRDDLDVTAGAWLARFCHEMQSVLLAELDVRLQPTAGLIEAFNNEIKPPK